jgi:hypothetical protein
MDSAYKSSDSEDGKLVTNFKFFVFRISVIVTLRILIRIISRLSAMFNLNSAFSHIAC